MRIPRKLRAIRSALRVMPRVSVQRLTDVKPRVVLTGSLSQYVASMKES